jgi:DNA invertase Pin-like site-specific DNA recombinase
MWCATNGRLPGARDALRSEKIHPWHRERLAVVYVRQSTAQQVLDHQESTRLQYGLASRAQALGWAVDRVLVIDDDLGKSGASAEGRVGFQRLVSEVSLDHVGLILGVEMSRLARSNKDWHQLLELCALFGTLIADLDGIYDPAQYNDRLLLGLKGTMSEAELHILRQRMYQGRLSKARRGELTFALPTGYVWGAAGEIVFDPDEQVQAVVRLIFRKFAELGTLNGVLRYLAEHGIRLGIRVREGPGKGELVWRRPNRPTLQNVLKHPVYAGAYAYGRRQVDPRRKRPGRPSTGRVVLGPAEWLAFLPDRCPAYIPWEQYEANLARLDANRARAEAMGAVRGGPALLAGLVVCARCGCRLTVRYRGSRGLHSYVCSRLRGDYGGPSCRQHLAGPPLDACVSRHVLAALEPAALELSLTAAARLEQERADLARLWQQRRERAAYEAERAARQYQAVEPENRLVARSLERAWEEKLAAQQHLEEEYHRFVHQQPRVLTPGEQAAVRRLAADLPALWEAPTTTAADRKAIIRQVIARVVVDVQGPSERVQVTLHWSGGGQTDAVCRRPVTKVEHLSTYPQLCDRLAVLVGEGLPAWRIAERLNAEGYRPPKYAARFGAQSVRELLRRQGLSPYRSRPKPITGLRPDEWGRSALAGVLEIPTGTLDNWIRHGWVTARHPPPPSRRWIIWADAAELERLRQFRERPIAAEVRQHWTAATREAHDA